MEWISSLLHSRCPFCGQAMPFQAQACSKCALGLTELERVAPQLKQSEDLLVLSLFSYEGRPRDLILRQKIAPRRGAVGWFAGRLELALPAEWRGLPLIWIPGHSIGPPHLVEALALELFRRGRPLAPKCFLRRRFWGGRPQKQLGERERRAPGRRHPHEGVRTPKGWSAPPEALLLDDVATTGATLATTRKLLLERSGIRVRAAAVLARTPLLRP